MIKINSTEMPVGIENIFEEVQELYSNVAYAIEMITNETEEINMSFLETDLHELRGSVCQLLSVVSEFVDNNHD